MAAPAGTQAVDRASTLLLAVIEAPKSVPFSDLVSTTGLPKSTVSRLLTSLERHGLVQRTSDSSVRPGPALTRFAMTAKADRLVRLARPHLDRIADVTGETVNLAVPTPSAVEQIAQVDSRHLLGAVNWVGRPVPFHCSALGKVFLAFGASEAARGRLERRTDRTLTSRVDLAQDLARVRRLGYAVADGELEPGLVAVAAPVRDAEGNVIAALSVSGPAVRLTPQAIPTVGRLLAQEAQALSDELQARQNSRSRRAGAA
jgi:IclR family acetate operon transcriptional repressor